MKQLILLLSLFPLSFLFGEEEIILQNLKGRVEICTSGGKWESAGEGMILQEGTKIATGFSSSAILKTCNSQTLIKPLTRLTIQEVLAREDKTALFLGIGSINAKVKHTSGSLTNYSVQTPVSTASVRGTEFSLTPYRLQVKEGSVWYSRDGYQIIVARGQESILSDWDDSQLLNNPVDIALSRRRVSTIAGEPENSEANNQFPLDSDRGLSDRSLGRPTILIE